ncbi:hypothetical protein [Streptomyces parvus]|uniref:hypothetical protein n=1 Tax=Streptomyces parvus TaxID=66428 RepID=UPI0021015C3A|nr:hypothetical protein [Streptomyces parvus]MCQ1577016.1 hypothetical protein [Streptomyces parvus]
MKRTKFAATITAALATAFAGSVFLAPTASAATGGNCNLSATSGECLILFYNSNLKGSRITFDTPAISNFAGYKYLGTGAGKGQDVKNNAASAIYGSTSSGDDYGVIFYNSGFGGPCDQIYSGAAAPLQLKNTYNNNASYAAYPYSIPGCYNFF